MNKIIEIEMKDVKSLLESGKTVKVLSLGGEYVKIEKYIEKGVMKTYKVELENGNSIKCSAKHLFYANTGWIQASDLIPNKTKIMTETTKFVLVSRVDYIGDFPIVDITVDHPEECYYGNGILNHNSGKSLLAAHIMAETQRKGGVAVFIDTEYAVSSEFLQAIGVDVSKMLYLNLTTVEDIFDKVEEIIEQVRKSNKNRIVTIVVDSVAAASTKKELESDHGADGFATGKAIAISKAMRKITELIAKQRIALIFTNQLRQKVGFVGLGDPWTTSGGKAIAFHASLRIRLQAAGRIVNGDKRVVGIKTKAKIIKNRMGPPFRSVDFDIYFDRGIDNYGNWLQNLMEWDIITNAKKDKPDPTAKKKSKKELEAEKEMDKKAKSLQFIMNEEQGDKSEKVVFEKKDFPKLLVDRPDCKEYLYQKMCSTYVMKYKTSSDTTDDEISLDESSDGMED